MTTKKITGQGLFNMKDKIHFYKVNDLYSVFSNFYKCGFLLMKSTGLLLNIISRLKNSMTNL